MKSPRPLVSLTLLALFVVSPVFANGPRVLAQGAMPDDVRLQPPKDLNGYFPFTPSKSPAEWEKRADYVRRQILVSQGLWPMPTKGPLNAVIHGRIDRPEYTVEKVCFESSPGFFVTGNLYRPKNPKGKVPAVMFGHGHWQDARLLEETPEKLRQEIATGQERFEQGGRSRVQSMCVQLARMGCVVWQWDMLSDSDSRQLSREIVHRFARQRPEMNTTTDWGLYSPQAEARLQSIMGLQTWNSIRSLDFLLTLPEVDPERTAITGASGGGTQASCGDRFWSRGDPQGTTRLAEEGPLAVTDAAARRREEFDHRGERAQHEALHVWADRPHHGSVAYGTYDGCSAYDTSMPTPARTIAISATPLTGVNAAEWERLLAANPTATAFSDRAVHAAWWSAHSDTAQDVSLAARDAASNELIGYLPLMKRPDGVIYSGATFHIDYATVLLETTSSDTEDDVAAALSASEPEKTWAISNRAVQSKTAGMGTMDCPKNMAANSGKSSKNPLLGINA